MPHDSVWRVKTRGKEGKNLRRTEKRNKKEGQRKGGRYKSYLDSAITVTYG